MKKDLPSYHRMIWELQWEREYYGDVLNRMGRTLWLREYSV